MAVKVVIAAYLVRLDQAVILHTLIADRVVIVTATVTAVGIVTAAEKVALVMVALVMVGLHVNRKVNLRLSVIVHMQKKIKLL
jgi:hypothetical protein